jgi:hypothetical protein
MLVQRASCYTSGPAGIDAMGEMKTGGLRMDGRR